MLDLLNGIFDGMKPTEIITVSEWAEKYRYLSPEASFLGGSLYSCDVTPYARKIMDCLSIYSSYQEVVFCKSSQTGGTEIGYNWLGYLIHICPGPILMLMPTDGTVERNSKIRLDPMIENCKELRERVAEKKSRDGDNTINQKRFVGGVLYMGGANSPAVLKSIPVRFLMLDEIDEYPIDLGGQGNATDLAEVRTQMFPNRKKYLVSTPTIEGSSQISEAFKNTDQNYYEVPCPLCGGYQKLIFEQLKWEHGKPESVRYQCIHCSKQIEELYKTEMLARGEWVPFAKEKINKKRIGFHINSLYAPTSFFKWADIIERFEKAEKDPNKMKVFINTILGETYAEKSDAPKYENLYNRREDYPINQVPNDVCFLVAGVDIQKDRIEIEIVGYGIDKQSWSIDFRVLLGNTTLPDVWNQLGEIVYESWTKQNGSDINIKLMAIDTGFNTTEVYDFCRKYPNTKVIPVKGAISDSAPAISAPRTIDYSKHGKKIGRTKVWMVGTSNIKKEIYAWLSLEINEDKSPPCYCHFPQYDAHYFQGLTAEDYIVKKKQWKKRFERNEPLDCRVYARAASIVVGLDRLKPQQLMALNDYYVHKNKPEKTDMQPEKIKIRKEPSIWD